MNDHMTRYYEVYRDLVTGCDEEEAHKFWPSVDMVSVVKMRFYRRHAECVAERRGDKQYTNF